MTNPTERDPRTIVTDVCRIAFPALFTPKPRFKGSDKMTFQAVVLIPPDTGLGIYHEAIVAAMDETFGKRIPLKGDKNPIRACADRPTEIDGYEDDWSYVNTHSGYQPQVVDQKLRPILSLPTDRLVTPDERGLLIEEAERRIFAGCWCRFYLQAFAWSHPTGGKGVSFSLNGVQLIREDIRLGRKAAADVFQAVDVPEGDTGAEEEADDVSSLFG